MTETKAITPGRGRIVLGCALLVLSIVPWAIAPLTPLLGLPGGRLAGAIASLLVAGEILGALAIAVLGREAYDRIKHRLRRRGSATRATPDGPTNDASERETPHE
jgi:hypothetical protein